MSDLIRAHLVEYGTAACITRRQTHQVLVQMALHLPLGLDHETKARAVSCGSSENADSERAAIPQRVEQARSRAQFLQSSFAPRQMIGFFFRGAQQKVPRRIRTGYQRLAVIESLGGNLACVVYTHERCGLEALRVG